MKLLALRFIGGANLVSAAWYHERHTLAVWIGTHEFAWHFRPAVKPLMLIRPCGRGWEYAGVCRERIPWMVTTKEAAMRTLLVRAIGGVCLAYVVWLAWTALSMAFAR